MNAIQKALPKNLSKAFRVVLLRRERQERGVNRLQGNSLLLHLKLFESVEIQGGKYGYCFLKFRRDFSF